MLLVVAWTFQQWRWLSTTMCLESQMTTSIELAAQHGNRGAVVKSTLVAPCS